MQKNKGKGPFRFQNPIALAEAEAYMEEAVRAKILFWKDRDVMFNKWYGTVTK